MIFAIKPFETHDGDGIRTTVFFKGCSLRCKWCHNPESLSFKKEIFFDAHMCINCLQCTKLCDANIAADGKHIFIRENCTLCGKCIDICPNEVFEIQGLDISAGEIVERVLEDKLFMIGSGGGVTLSGGECLCQADFCAGLLRSFQEEGIHTAVDTCGFVPKEAIDKVMPYTDTFLYDIKAIDEDVHIKCTGQSNKLILENLNYIDACGKTIQVRIPYVPGYNDDQIDKIAEFLKPFKHVKEVKVLPYHNYAEAKYNALGMENTLPKKLPTNEEIEAAQKKFQFLSK